MLKSKAQTEGRRFLFQSGGLDDGSDVAAECVVLRISRAEDKLDLVLALLASILLPGTIA